MSRGRTKSSKSGVLIKGDTMIDANVLILSLRSQAAIRTAAPDVRELISASKLLMMSLPVVRMSAVSFGEVFRKMSSEEAAALAAVGVEINDFFAEPLTGDMARLAAALINRRDTKDDYCPRCLNPASKASSPPCKLCQRLVSPHKRMDDAFIVATAALSYGVRRLVTADRGVCELRNILGKREITERFPGVEKLDVEWVRADHGPLFSAQGASVPAIGPVDSQPDQPRRVAEE